MVNPTPIEGLMPSLNMSEAAAAMMLDGLRSALALSVSSVFLNYVLHLDRRDCDRTVPTRRTAS